VSWLPIFLHSNEVIDHLKSLRALSVVLREFSLEFNVALEFIEGFLALIVILDRKADLIVLCFKSFLCYIQYRQFLEDAMYKALNIVCSSFDFVLHHNTHGFFKLNFVKLCAVIC